MDDFWEFDPPLSTKRPFLSWFKTCQTPKVSAFPTTPRRLGKDLGLFAIATRFGTQNSRRLPRFLCDWSYEYPVWKGWWTPVIITYPYSLSWICENDGHPKLWLGGGFICFLVLVFHPYLGNESIWTIFSNGLKPPARWCHVRVMSCLVSTVYAGCDRWVFALFGASRKIGWRITLGWWTNNTLWRDQGMCLCGGLILPTSSSMIRE